MLNHAKQLYHHKFFSNQLKNQINNLMAKHCRISDENKKKGFLRKEREQGNLQK